MKLTLGFMHLHGLEHFQYGFVPSLIREPWYGPDVSPLPTSLGSTDLASIVMTAVSAALKNVLKMQVDLLAQVIKKGSKKWSQTRSWPLDQVWLSKGCPKSAR